MAFGPLPLWPRNMIIWAQRQLADANGAMPLSLSLFLSFSLCCQWLNANGSMPIRNGNANGPMPLAEFIRRNAPMLQCPMPMPQWPNSKCPTPMPHCQCLNAPMPKPTCSNGPQCQCQWLNASMALGRMPIGIREHWQWVIGIRFGHLH